MDKELEKNKRESRLEKSREDKLLAFIGGKFIIYILLIVILLGIAIYLYTEISYIFTPIITISTVIIPTKIASRLAENLEIFLEKKFTSGFNM